MKTVELTQGTPEWHAHRARHLNASDAPAMMGCSPYTTRTELLSRLHTGISKEVDPATQRIFDNGHKFEALARPLAEGVVGQDLYPVTGVRGKYSASFDGLTMMEDIAFEHKTLNADLTEWFDKYDELDIQKQENSAGNLLPLHYRVQMEHQAMVSGCEHILFMASKWDGNELIEYRHCWYSPDDELRAKIVAGWAQLEEDLKTFVPPAAATTPTGKSPDTLPALRIEVTGMVTASNLEDFKAMALMAIRSINRELMTDQDFADAEQVVKWCSDVESRLKAAKEHALSQTESIDRLFKAIDDISAEARKVRLELDKLVKSRKDELRMEIINNAQAMLNSHVRKLNERIGWVNGVPMLSIAQADFSGAIKGKKNIDNMRDAVATELANAKIKSNELADLVERNIKTLSGEAHNWGFLFPDLAIVSHKSIEDFANLLSARIQAHERAEAARREKEADAQKVAQLVRQAAESPAITTAISDAVTTGTGFAITTASSNGITTTHVQAPEVFDNGVMLNLRDINARIAPLAITTAGLAELGFEPAAIDRASRLYRECDFPVICTALINHLQGAIEATLTPAIAG